MSKADSKSFKVVVADYAMQKVVDWSLKYSNTASSEKAHFHWSVSDKDLLKSTIFSKKAVASRTLPLEDKKFKAFVESIIENGLNLDDLRLFQRYKDRLPLRAMGLAYTLDDFRFSKKGLASINKIETGFYMLEIEIMASQYSSKLPLVFSEISATRRSSGKQFLLDVQTNKIGKRLLKIDYDSYFHLTMDSVLQKEHISHFKIAKLSKNFFLSRLYKKIGKEFDIKNSSQITDQYIQELWQKYDNLFIKKSMWSNENYHESIKDHEAAMLSDNDSRLYNLFRLLSRK
jgi:hypothetical protein